MAVPVTCSRSEALLSAWSDLIWSDLQARLGTQVHHLPDTAVLVIPAIAQLPDFQVTNLDLTNPCHVISLSLAQ